MTVVINEKTLGIWYAPTDGGNVALHLAHVDGQQYEITLRLRSYAEKQSPDPFDGTDEKKAWKIEVKHSTRQAAIEKARDLITKMPLVKKPNEAIEILNDTNLTEFLFKLTAHPNIFHMRTS